MRKIIYILFLLFSFSSVTRAQEKVIYQDTSLLQKEEQYVAPVEEITETSVDTLVQQQYVNDETDTTLYRNNLDLAYDSIKNWRNLKEYAYTRYLDSLLRNEKKQKPEEPPRSSGGSILGNLLSSGFMSIVLWSVVILFVLFIVYRLFLADGVFQRKSKAATGVAEITGEVITKESDFDKLIRLALQNGNYRQAVRYQYLRTLHLLAGKNFVELAPDKTNFQYVHEITNRSHQQEFAALTLNYEYVWYGEFAIEKDIYKKIETNFISLNQKL